LDPGVLTAVFAGHNFRLKGLPQALAALALGVRGNTDRRCQLIVMGGGHTSRMLRLARRLGLAEAVRFVGNTRNSERYYAASDFLLFPTFYDPCANVTFEALASGIPVVTTRRNGASELVTNGREGWIVEHPGCVEQMAEHIAKLREPERLAEMKRAARCLAAAHPIAGKFAEIEEILEDAGRLL